MRVRTEFPRTVHEIENTRIPISSARLGGPLGVSSARVSSRDADPAPGARLTPRLRGVSHQYAFFLAVLGGGVLVMTAETARAQVAATVYALSVAAMFGASAVYHGFAWAPAQRRRLRRLDHAMIYVLIAGTYTPVASLALSGAWRTAVLALAWAGALGAIVLTLAWNDAPNWVAAVTAATLGWVGVVAVPQLLGEIGPIGVGLLFAGGILYTAGSLVYACRRPDPVPAVFGYHELFHALVIAAAACQYASIAFFVLRPA